MQEQKEILERYISLKGKMTFKEISKDTGIQMTRVFRLFNGAPMKLNEYLLFKNKIIEQREEYKFVSSFVENEIFKLNERDVTQLEQILKRMKHKNLLAA